MNPDIVPIKKLPPGLTGHLEIRDILPNRDWRDTAIGWAALAGASYFALPHLFLFHWLETAIGVGLTLYLLKATTELRIFTPIDQCSVRAVIEPVKPDSASTADCLASVESNLASSPADGRAIPDSNGKVVHGC